MRLLCAFGGKLYAHCGGIFVGGEMDSIHWFKRGCREARGDRALDRLLRGNLQGLKPDFTLGHLRHD